MSNFGFLAIQLTIVAQKNSAFKSLKVKNIKRNLKKKKNERNKKQYINDMNVLCMKYISLL